MNTFSENHSEIGDESAQESGSPSQEFDFEQLDIASIRESVEKMAGAKEAFDQIMQEMKEAIRAEAARLADQPEEVILDAVERIRQEHKEKFRKHALSLGIDLQSE